MPTFDTPEWVSASIDLARGEVHVRGVAATTTTVDVQPHSHRPQDVEEAAAVRVAYDAGRLSVRSGPNRQALPWRRGSVVVRLEVPEGAEIGVRTGDGEIVAEGRLGDLTARTADGEVRVAEVASCRVDSGDGEVRVHRVAGDAEVTTGDGDVHVEDVGGHARLGTGDGDVRIGRAAAGAELRTGDGDCIVGLIGGAGVVRTASGDIRVERATGDLDAATSSGDIDVRVAEEGVVRLSTSSGDVRIGVPTGTAAWLDLDTAYGDVVSALDAGTGPQDGERVLRLHVRTGSGDVVVTRA